MKDIKKFIVNEKDDIYSILKTININKEGICFVVNHEETMVGVITDGDIRRHIINSNDMLALAKDIMTIDFVSLNYKSEISIINSTFSNKIKIIPLIDEDGRIVDISFRNKPISIPVLEPNLSGNELQYVTDCISTNWISSQGAYVSRFEKIFSEMHDDMHAVSSSNGTTALHLALMSLGIESGDEVIVPNLTFAASINSIIHAGANPVLCDVNKENFNIDFRNLDQLITNKTKAIMVVHLYGRPVEMDEVLKIAKKYNLLIIEDCAEALGSRYNNQNIGTFGDASCFSFFGNKTITTGEGGMVIFKNKKFAELARKLRDHGMSPKKRYWHDVIGYNYRMTNLQAAIGVAQMERIDEIILKKRSIADLYKSHLVELKNIKFLPDEGANEFSTYWLYTITLNENINTDTLINKMKKYGIETRPCFYPIHEMPIYSKYVSEKTNYKNSEFISRHSISLPSSVNLSDKEIKYICSMLEESIK